MPSNIFAKQIVFPAYETNVSTSFFIPANELEIQHLFILHLFLNSSKTACIGSIQDIWRIWVWSVCYRLGSNLVQELPLPNTAVKGQACAKGSILVGCMAISRVKFQGKHEKLTALLQNMHKYSNVCRNLDKETKSMGKEKLGVQNTKNNWLRVSKYSGSEIGSQTLKSLKSVRRRDQN